MSKAQPDSFAWRLLPAAAVLCLGSAPSALAQEEPTPDTMQAPAEQAADPDEQADAYRVRRERESDESSAVVRAREGQDTGGEEGGEYAGNSQLKDAWLDGKLEVAYALNRHLSPFSIDTSVENGIVSLSGEVGSEIDKELAGEVARNIEGIEDVRNDLIVRQGGTEAAAGAAEPADADDERTFADRIDDATTTAAVKSKLMMDDETGGLQINVDTRNHVVTLSGNVDSEAERELAEQIASNVEEVERVQNELEVVAATGRDEP